MQTFYPEFESFAKNGDKFDWVKKYWQMTFNWPNSPKFSPTTILHYTVFIMKIFSKSFNFINAK